MEHQKTEVEDTYMSRNGPWLKPLFAVVLLLAAVTVLSKMGPPPEWWPTSMPVVGAAIGCFVSGIYASLTYTLSARIFRVIAMFGAVACLIWVVGINFFGW